MASNTITLPIDIVPGYNPPVFKLKQVVDTLNGKQVREHQDAMPVTIEVAMTRLISVTKQLLMENASLHGEIKSLKDKLERKTADRTENTTIVETTHTAPVLAQPKKGKS